MESIWIILVAFVGYLASLNYFALTGQQQLYLQHQSQALTQFLLSYPSFQLLPAYQQQFIMSQLQQQQAIQYYQQNDPNYNNKNYNYDYNSGENKPYEKGTELEYAESSIVSNPKKSSYLSSQKTLSKSKGQSNNMLSIWPPGPGHQTSNVKNPLLSQKPTDTGSFPFPQHFITNAVNDLSKSTTTTRTIEKLPYPSFNYDHKNPSNSKVTPSNSRSNVLVVVNRLEEKNPAKSSQNFMKPNEANQIKSNYHNVYDDNRFETASILPPPPLPVSYVYTPINYNYNQSYSNISDQSASNSTLELNDLKKSNQIPLIPMIPQNYLKSTIKNENYYKLYPYSSTPINTLTSASDPNIPNSLNNANKTVLNDSSTSNILADLNVIDKELFKGSDTDKLNSSFITSGLTRLVENEKIEKLTNLSAINTMDDMILLTKNIPQTQTIASPRPNMRPNEVKANNSMTQTTRNLSKGVTNYSNQNPTTVLLKPKLTSKQIVDDSLTIKRTSYRMKPFSNLLKSKMQNLKLKSESSPASTTEMILGLNKSKNVEKKAIKLQKVYPNSIQEIIKSKRDDKVNKNVDHKHYRTTPTVLSARKPGKLSPKVLHKNLKPSESYRYENHYYAKKSYYSTTASTTEKTNNFIKYLKSSQVSKTNFGFG